MKPDEIVAERFRVEMLAGEGGMGAVYRALDLRTGQRVALKILHQTRAKHLARFQREAKLLSDLDHPGIVRYVDHGKTPSGHAYLAMQWLEGEDLGVRLERGRLSVRATVDLAARVADALGEAHARGIVHRDLKPSNLFLVAGRIESVQIIDFGIARALGQTQLTDTGAMLGTLGYMAPEQARGEPGVDARADVFALGAVMYRSLTGEAAFEGSDPLSSLLRLAQGDAPHLRAAIPSAPVALDALVARMLSRLPGQRPSDGHEVHQALLPIARKALDDAVAAIPSSRRVEVVARESDGSSTVSPFALTTRLASDAVAPAEPTRLAGGGPERRSSSARRALSIVTAAAVFGGATGETLWLRHRSAAPPCAGDFCESLPSELAGKVDPFERGMSADASIGAAYMMSGGAPLWTLSLLSERRFWMIDGMSCAFGPRGTSPAAAAPSSKSCKRFVAVINRRASALTNVVIELDEGEQRMRTVDVSATARERIAGAPGGIRLTVSNATAHEGTPIPATSCTGDCTIAIAVDRELSWDDCGQDQ